jgi:hypothetical protein
LSDNNGNSDYVVGALSGKEWNVWKSKNVKCIFFTLHHYNFKLFPCQYSGDLGVVLGPEGIRQKRYLLFPLQPGISISRLKFFKVYENE